ncbi:protein GVQW3 [Trichonephila clavipes]|nr:protein GVQW3 [Trichonephila clavipes]
MSDNNFEQRYAIKFCFRLGHNATETFAKLQQAYGDSVVSRALVFWWFKAFSERRESFEDEPCSGRPSVSRTAENVVRVQDLVHSDLDRFLGSKNIPVTPQPPYWPVLMTFPLSEIEESPQGTSFRYTENIQTAATDQLKAIPISEFHQCYKEWRNVSSAVWLQKAVTLKETMLNCKFIGINK